MKKTFIALFAIAMIGGTVASCKKDKKEDCTSASKRAAEAATAFAQSQSAANCNNYKAAMQDLLNGDCACSLSSDQKAMYQEALNGLNCDAR